MGTVIFSLYSELHNKFKSTVYKYWLKFGSMPNKFRNFINK